MPNVIAVVYVGAGVLVADMKRRLGEACPEADVLTIIDDSLIREAIRSGGMTKRIQRRLLRCFANAVDAGADIIVCACSSMGEGALLADRIFDVPVLRIDRAMIETGLELGNRIGVLASLETTMIPTVSYIESIALERGKAVDAVGAVAAGAYEAMKRGDTATHDRLILETARSLAGRVDALLLAQGSMAAMEGPLAAATGLPVLSSPRLCALQVQTILANMEK